MIIMIIVINNSAWRSMRLFVLKTLSTPRDGRSEELETSKKIVIIIIIIIIIILIMITNDIMIENEEEE